MKPLLLVMYFFLGLLACGSPEIEREEVLRDNSPGVGAFKRAGDDKLEDENPEEEDEDCRYYNGGGFSLLGKSSPSLWLQNCMAKQIDENLKPLCDEEQRMRDALEDCRRRKCDDEELLEEHLSAIEDQKYEIADGIYAMADESSNIADELRDKVDSSQRFGSSGKPIRRIFASLLNMTIDSEVGSITRVLDSRARVVCRNIDLSRIPSRR